METQNILVLLVEDEAIVRLVTAVGLEDAGFAVIEAESAQQALDAMAANPDIGVLFTDVNMPGDLNGIDLARQVHERWPKVRIVVTSGRFYQREQIPDDGRFLAKPYTLQDAAKAVNAVSPRRPG